MVTINKLNEITNKCIDLFGIEPKVKIKYYCKLWNGERFINHLTTSSKTKAIKLKSEGYNVLVVFDYKFEYCDSIDNFLCF